MNNIIDNLNLVVDVLQLMLCAVELARQVWAKLKKFNN